MSRTVTGGGGGGGGSSSNAAAEFGFYRSALVSFLTPAVISCNLPVVVPAGKVFYPDFVGVVVTALSGGALVDQPTISWGINGNTSKYKVPTLMTSLTAANFRDVFSTLIAADGIPFGTTPTVEITVGGSGPTTYEGYIYFSGVNVP